MTINSKNLKQLDGRTLLADQERPASRLIGLQVVIAIIALLAAWLLLTRPTSEAKAQAGAGPSARPLEPLQRIHLMVHALNGLELTPDNPLRKSPQWELWPGRCETSHQYEFGLKEKYYALMSRRGPNTRVFVLPTEMKGGPPSLRS